jgi:tagatose 1,6-diphosphate aldolase
MTSGKFNHLNAVADERGVIAALAVDQRGALKQAISNARGSEISDAELSEFKLIVTEALSPYASAVLLDPEYSLDAINHRAKNAG